MYLLRSLAFLFLAQAALAQPRNQKLTKVIAGRTIQTATAEQGSVLIVFDDDSRMKIRTAAAVTVSPGGKVKSVQEDEAGLKIEFEDG